MTFSVNLSALYDAPKRFRLYPAESPNLAIFRIGNGVAEEVEEEGLGEGVELGEGGAALGPQRLRARSSTLRNPPLLRQRRRGDFQDPRPMSLG